MSDYFLDTSYLIALVLNTDQYHVNALKKWQSIKGSKSFVTTSYVFDETVTYLNRRGHHAKVVEVGEKIFLSSAVELIHVNEHLFFEGWYAFCKYQDKGFSLTDCISFIVMRQRGLSTALTFDKDFSQAGFQVEP